MYLVHNWHSCSVWHCIRTHCHCRGSDFLHRWADDQGARAGHQEPDLDVLGLPHRVLHPRHHHPPPPCWPRLHRPSLQVVGTYWQAGTGWDNPGPVISWRIMADSDKTAVEWSIDLRMSNLNKTCSILPQSGSIYTFFYVIPILLKII